MARPKRGRGSLHARDGQEGGGKTGGQEKAHQNCGGLCHTMELILQQVSWCSTERESSIKKGPKISFSRAFRQVAISCAGNVAKAPFLEASPRRIAAGEGSLSGWRSRCRYRAGVRRAMLAEWANAASHGPASRDDGRSLVRETWVSMFSLNRKSSDGTHRACRLRASLCEQIDRRTRRKWQKYPVRSFLFLKSEIKSQGRLLYQLS